MISRKGMKEILDSDYLNNLIPYDEFMSAIHCKHPRQDCNNILGDTNFRAYAFNVDYINQSSHYDKDSLTEFTPEYVKQIKQEENKVESPKQQFEILDASNWEEWSHKYINKQLIDRKYDLIIDEPATHVYLFPLFTKRFCKELINLSEEHEWTTDRHEFYPTTDNLMETLGMKEIYNKVINDYVRPYSYR